MIHDSAPHRPDTPGDEASAPPPATSRPVSPANLTRSTLSGGGLLTMAAMAQVLFQFVTVGILARLLNPTDFGVAAAALLLIELSQSLALVGMRPAVVQRLDLNDTDIRAAYTLAFLLSVAVAGLIFIFASPLASALRTPAAEPMVRVLALVFIIQAQSTVAEGLASRRRQFKLLAVRRSLSYLVGYGVVGIGCALAGLGAWALVAAKLADSITTAVLLSIGVPHPRKLLFNKTALRGLSNFGAGYTVNQIANSLANQSDNVVVARLLGPAALGLYSRSYQIMRLPALLIGNIVEDVAFPGFSSIQKDRTRMARGLYRALVAMNMVLFLAATICFVLAPEIIAIALGPKWKEAASLLQLFTLAMPFRSSQRLATTISRATGANWSIASRQVIYFFSVVIFAAAGVHWGLQGVVIGVTIAILLQSLMQFQLASRLTGLSLTDILTAHLRALPAMTLLGVAMWSTAEVLRSAVTNPVVIAATAGFAGSAALVLGAVIHPRAILTAEGLQLLAAVAGRLPARLSGRITAWVREHDVSPT